MITAKEFKKRGTIPLDWIHKYPYDFAPAKCKRHGALNTVRIQFKDRINTGFYFCGVKTIVYYDFPLYRKGRSVKDWVAVYVGEL